MESAVVYPRRFASLVKLEHTVFALPFAYVGAFLALDEVPSAAQMVWLTLAMIGARSLAMAINRLVDARIDARNPRTAGRELPQGTLRPWQVARLLRRLTGRLPARCLQPRPGRALAVADPRCDVRRLPLPQARDVAQPRLAGRHAGSRARRWLGSDDG